MFDQTKATVIAHSKSSVTGKEVVTFELEFPRLILAEFNTHNALSKNASSSRAIPVPTMLKQVRENPAMPVRFGAANSGMQDKGEHNELVIMTDGQATSWGGMYPDDAWSYAANQAADLAERFHEAGYAKQICNRLIEPFQMMKVVMTATELNNFIWLRDHFMADPTIAALARKIKTAFEASVPVVLQPGEWHVPYYNNGYWKPASFQPIEYFPNGPVIDVFGHSLEHALIISSSCCAQVSFRSLDDTVEKARRVVSKLNLNGEEPDQPVHASPLEHQCSPFECADYDSMLLWMLENDKNEWLDGVTHVDRDGQLGSGNMKGWKQHRQLVSNHVKRG